MVLSVHSALQVVAFSMGTILRLFKPPEDTLEVVLHDLNAMALVLVTSLVALNLVLCVFDPRLQLLLLVVKFVLEGQEMLIERDTVPQERLIAACLILLIDLLVLEELDLRLHGGDLLVQVKDNVLMNGILLGVSMLARLQLLHFLGRCRHIRMTLELRIDNRACVSCIDIIIRCGELHVTGV